jgi:cell division protein FtsL
MSIGAKKPPEKRRTPPSGPGVRQLHQRKLTQSRVRGGPRQGPAPDRPLRLALLATAVLTVGTIFGAAIFHVLLIQSEFRLDQINKEASKEEARYGKLRLDVAQLSAPERIVATAQQRLGMVVPPQVAYLMAPVPQDSGGPGADPDDPAAPSLAGGWAEVKPHLGTRP